MAGPDLPALLAARICHDLISPLGAVGNGLELIELMSSAESPEFSLIRDSAEAAIARVRFFRIAFGRAAPGQRVSPAEAQTLLDGSDAGSRVAILWNVSGDQEQALVKPAFLAVMCLLRALPHGGSIEVTKDGDTWRIEGRGARITALPPFDDLIAGGKAEHPPEPSQIEYALFADTLARMGRLARAETGEGLVALEY